jgi:plasmid stability protein
MGVLAMNAENSAIGAEMLGVEMNPMAVILASDCGRGIGLPEVSFVEIK